MNFSLRININNAGNVKSERAKFKRKLDKHLSIEMQQLCKVVARDNYFAISTKSIHENYINTNDALEIMSVALSILYKSGHIDNAKLSFWIRESNLETLNNIYSHYKQVFKKSEVLIDEVMKQMVVRCEDNIFKVIEVSKNTLNDGRLFFNPLVVNADRKYKDKMVKLMINGGTNEEIKVLKDEQTTLLHNIFDKLVAEQQ